jgi:hypothetical protein
VYLQDPAYPTWGGIMVKDWTAGFVLANGVSIGDRVDLSTVYIEEASDKNTVLQFGAPWEPGSSFVLVSSGNEVPNPIMLTAADIPIPTDHASSEQYESMVITLEDVVVGQRDLGRKDDNYELLQGGDTAWGADYQNIGAGGPYHPYIFNGARLHSITGIVEQSFGDPDWDYYQLVTRSTNDIVPSTEIPAFIDIKPGSCPNSLNPMSHGFLSVALVGTDEFDVAMVDVSSIELSRADGIGGSVAPHEGPPGPFSVFEDVAAPFDGPPCECHEATDDGITDLLMKFATDDVVAILELGDAGGGEQIELVISGYLVDGTPFSGQDCIRMVPRAVRAGALSVAPSGNDAQNDASARRRSR